ncbi:MAG: beta-aspartyl-peptidase [Oscillospiraceae bacterium]|nr:beta-aspartyl-peptidase [Oscillospiraceae bacterium]
MLTLIKGGQVYAPQKLGICDMLLGGKQILAVAECLTPPQGIETQVIDASGKIVTPGYIDCHMHLLGAGGGHGPNSRSHEIDVSTLAKAGVTTVVGTLGINTISFSLRHLLMTLNALELQGITTLMYTGGYQFPVVTLMDSIVSDLSLIEKIVGVGEIALFDSLGSHPTMDMIKELASKVWLGGRMGGKPGLLHAHLGETGGSVKEIVDVLVGMGLPASMLMTTHVNRTEHVLQMSIEAGLAGASLDITALYTPDNGIPETIYPASALNRLLEANIPLENITMSSDGNAVQPIKNENGVIERFMLSPANAIAIEIKKAVMRDRVNLEDILPIVSINAAQRLGISDRKGSLEAGKDADVLLLDEDLEVDTVYAKGKLMLEQKKPVVVGHFEEDYAKISV